MYSLNLADDGRILSVCTVLPGGKYTNIVDSFPEGNLYEYRYVNGEFIHDPLPTPEPESPQPTQEERIAALEAQLASYEAAYTEGVNEA